MGSLDLAQACATPSWTHSRKFSCLAVVLPDMAFTCPGGYPQQHSSCYHPLVHFCSRELLLCLCRPVRLPAGPTSGGFPAWQWYYQTWHSLQDNHSSILPVSIHFSTFAHENCFCVGAGLYDSQLDPQQDFSCLAVVLDMALTPSQPGQQPMLYEQCLELVYRLAEQAHSREAMLSLLRKPPYSLLMSQIGVVLQVDEDRPQEVIDDLPLRIVDCHCKGWPYRELSWSQLKW